MSVTRTIAPQLPRAGRGTIALIAVNVLCYVLFLVALRTDGLRGFAASLALVPAEVVGDFSLWQPLTSLLIHAPEAPGHLLNNLLVLWFFGGPLEGRVGTRRMVETYLLCGLAGALATVAWGGLWQLAWPGASGVADAWVRPTLGASGAAMGLLLHWAALHWDETLHFMFLGPMKARTFALIVVAVESLYALSFSAVSSTSHFGGMALGYALGRSGWPPAGGWSKWWARRRNTRVHERLRRFEVIEGGGEGAPTTRPRRGGWSPPTDSTIH